MPNLLKAHRQGTQRQRKGAHSGLAAWQHKFNATSVLRVRRRYTCADYSVKTNPMCYRTPSPRRSTGRSKYPDLSGVKATKPRRDTTVIGQHWRVEKFGNHAVHDKEDIKITRHPVAYRAISRTSSAKPNPLLKNLRQASRTMVRTATRHRCLSWIGARENVTCKENELRMIV